MMFIKIILREYIYNLAKLFYGVEEIGTMKIKWICFYVIVMKYLYKNCKWCLGLTRLPLQTSDKICQKYSAEMYADVPSKYKGKGIVWMSQ